MVTWNQESPPPAGATYEWAGEPHASESIKYVDGVEVARNIVQNPSFEDPDPLAGVLTSTGTVTISSVTTAQTVHAGSRGLGVVIEDASPSAGWIAQDLASFSPGGWIAMSVRARNSVGMAPGLRFYFNFYDASGGSLDPSGYVGGDTIGSNSEPGDMTVLTVATPITAGATRARAFLRPREAVAFGRYHTDAWIAAVGATEAEALAQVETYFDGSFEDDRSEDTWIRPSDGAVFYWGGHAEGWRPQPVASGERFGSFIVNGSFENGTEGWPIGVASSHIVESPSAHSGRHVVQVQNNAVSNYYARSDFYEVDPTHEYLIESWARWTGGEESNPAFRLVRHYVMEEKPDGSEVGAFLSSSAVDVYDVPVKEWFLVAGGAYTPSPGTKRVRFSTHFMRYSGTTGLSYELDSFSVVDLTANRHSGVAEAGVATVDRRGLVSETFARSREKINIQLAEPDERLKGGERIELAAFAASSSEVTWRWRQVTGPEVFLVREGNTCHFQAPDVDNLTDMRIAVTASSVDGANRADWHYFDLEIRPAAGRFAGEGSDGFLPYTPQMVGYNRGKREIWNDVIAPVGMDPEGRKEPKLVDLGIPADDVTFSLDGEEPARASAGAVYVDIRDGAIYRNFGGGYNETDDTTGAPRLNAYMVNPATGEVFEWIEGADNGR